MGLPNKLRKVILYGVGPKARTRRLSAEKRVRKQRFDSRHWDRGDGAARRAYDSYEEYLEHQAAKLEKISKRLRKHEADDFDDFKRRFGSCAALRGSASSVLCLGARLGTEVRALRELGHFALGIDLEPGENNRWVLRGDFHALDFADGSVDVVYTNALDHVFDLQRVMGEVARVLKPGGAFVTDVAPGYEEGFTPGEFESHYWPTVDSLVDRILACGGLVKESRRDLGLPRQTLWIQVVFRRAETATDAIEADARG